MSILVSPDSRGRIALGRVAKNRQYAVDVDTDGVITLTPAMVVSQRDFEAMISIRPVLLPEEGFGRRGAAVAAQYVQENRSARSAGDWGLRVPTEDALHSLIWGGAA